MIDLLFDRFETLINAPNGVKKMREMILHLAVQGKLVTQNPNDEPASVLLKKIKAEKHKLIAEGKLKKDSLIPPIKSEEILYELPKGWEWTRLVNTGHIYNGNSVDENTKSDLSKVKEGYPYIATKDVGYGRERLFYDNGIRVPFNTSVRLPPLAGKEYAKL